MPQDGELCGFPDMETPLEWPPEEFDWPLDLDFSIDPPFDCSDLNL